MCSGRMGLGVVSLAGAHTQSTWVCRKHLCRAGIDQVPLFSAWCYTIVCSFIWFRQRSFVPTSCGTEICIRHGRFLGCCQLVSQLHAEGGRCEETSVGDLGEWTGGVNQ